MPAPRKNGTKKLGIKPLLDFAPAGRRAQGRYDGLDAIIHPRPVRGVKQMHRDLEEHPLSPAQNT